MTTTHTLKTDPAVFADVLSGAKTFEIRYNDRDFQVGDTLRLLETTWTGEEMRKGAVLNYTGREITKTVSHILTGYGLAEGWCCLSFLPEPFDVTLDENAVKLLRDTIVIGDDEDDVAPIRLVVGDGHSGHGLYLAQAEYQDEGAVLLTPTRLA